MKYIKALAIICSLLSSTISLAAPSADLWPRWQTHNADSLETISHQSWDAFLKKYIKRDEQGLNRLPYDKISKEDKASLDAYVENLQQTPISNYSRPEQRAYWSNLYNALTVKLVIEAMPVESILDIDLSGGFFSKGPWKKKLLTIEGQQVSLDDIEHRILRPIWRDPLTHYAVNCASVGCPNLQNFAFTADNIKRKLSRAAFEFINTARSVQINEDGELIVSSIYDWFKDDFGRSDAAVIQHLKRYAKPSLAEKLRKIEKIEEDQYDWSLNILKK